MACAHRSRNFVWTLLAGLLAACGTTDLPSDPSPTVASVAVTSATTTMTAFGSTIQLTAVAKDAAGGTISGRTFTWSSSDQTVVTVSSSGLATAVADGAASITATADGVDGSASLTVAQAVSSVDVTPASSNLTSVGATLQFSAVAKDANGNNVAGKTFTWSSSDQLVATVDAAGLATAVANGTATITETTDAVNGTAQLSVAPAVATIDVTPALGELNQIGATLLFSATAKDANGNAISGKTFTWASSNDLIATVNSLTGLATAVASGTATITASADGIDGSASLTMNLTGSGSNTMLVIANVTANDLGGGLFTTDFNVTLTDALAAPVSGATVTITNAVLGPIVLGETGPGSGVYIGIALQFPGGDFQLDIVRGTDFVQGVAARGPGVHTITAPIVDEIVAAGQDLTVTWSMPSQAKFAEIETRDYAALQLLDDGSVTIPGLNNPVNLSQRLRLFRFNDVDIAGGLLGSRLQIKIRSEIEPYVVQ